MIKTQIQIEEWQYEALKKQSTLTSRSMSDFVRQVLTDALKKRVPSRPLAEIAGKYRPVSSDDLKAHDADWAESIR